MATTKQQNSVFATLNAINVSGHVEVKSNGKTDLKYLSWSWAWTELKKVYPEAYFTIYENEKGWCYHTDGKTCWVKTGVTVEGLEHIEYLPIMDYRNNSIPFDLVTSFDVNKAIQRSLTKAAARHGLGLSVYAGEDLPDDARDVENAQAKPKAKAQPKQQPLQQQKPVSTDAKNIFGDALEEAFLSIKPEIESAPSRDYLNDLHKKNTPLHDYMPYKNAMNKRFMEVQ